MKRIYRLGYILAMVGALMLGASNGPAGAASPATVNPVFRPLLTQTPRTVHSGAAAD